MQSLSTQSVVEQMINELAARRRATAQRRAAYLALARVILQSDDAPGVHQPASAEAAA